MFQRILAWIREVIRKMIGTNSIKQSLNVDVAISAPMAEALQLWSAMYENKSPWLSKDVHSLNLAAAISGEIARAVTIEMAAEITGSARAVFLQEQLDQVIPKLRGMVEQGVAKGGLMMKPYVTGKRVAVDFVQADQFYPIAFDANGNITACVFADQRTIGDRFYTRLEYHTMTPEGCEIKNLAFQSTSREVLGQPVALATVNDWAELTPEATITGIDKPLFAYFRYPLANNVDPTSPLGASCYSRAVNLIEDADRQWSDFLWEFESGQRALYADILAFTTENGKKVLPQKRLYRALNGAEGIGAVGENPEGLFHEWTPTLREVNILNGLDAILRRIEFACGLAYGTLSNPQSVDKTATELKVSQQRSYVTVKDTQKSLEAALNQLLYAIDVWASIYNLAPKGAWAAVFAWDDSVIVDKDAQFQQDARLVGMGIMSKLEFRMRNFGEDEATAKAKIAQVTAEQPEDLFSEQGGK